MPFPPCDVCNTGATAYLFTRIADGETVHVCDDCQPPFAAWLLQATIGADPEAVLALAGSAEVTPPDGRSAGQGEVEGPEEVDPPPRRRRSGPTSPGSSPVDSLPEPSEPASGDATATDAQL